MCKIGDIILIDSYEDNHKILRQHSFIIIEDKNGTVEGLSYDIICNVFSSFKNEKQKSKKMSYLGNFPIANNDTITNPDNGRDGYVKTDQLYYFNKSKIKYKIIGFINPDILQLIFEFIEESDFSIVEIKDNI